MRRKSISLLLIVCICPIAVAPACGENEPCPGAAVADSGTDDTESESGMQKPQRFWLVAGQQYACVGVSLIPGGTCWGDPDEMSDIPPERFVHVDGTYMFTAGINTEGDLVYWGKNEEVEHLKIDPTDSSCAWLEISPRHICAIEEEGTLYCWGENHFGQSAPPDSADFVQVAIGRRDSCGLRSDGSLACFGLLKQNGQTIPTGPFLQISGGNDHFCALGYDGTITCFGHYNTHGEATPPDGSDFRFVASGGNHSCAIRDDNSIVCWGHNTYGGSTPPDRHFATVSVGQWSACGLDVAGGIYCWGLSVSNVPTELTWDAFAEYVDDFI